MKIFHLSDLHIGKQLHMYDLFEEQKYVFDSIIEAAVREKPDAVVIAGDIYDKSAPSADAVDLLDYLLNAFSKAQLTIPVMMISGNHDNGSRLNYASGLLENHNIYISAMPPRREDEHLKRITLSDEFGEVDFYLLPFVRPSDARNLLGGDCRINTYDEAVLAMLDRESIDYNRRNVLISHQLYVSGGKQPLRSDSELKYITIGGIDSVDISHVERFDYVALGHLHRSQEVGAPHIRYSGAPLKYSVGEASDSKSITVVELGEKGSDIGVRFIPLDMLHDVKRLRGSFGEILAAGPQDAFVSITLTDREKPFMPKDRLQQVYGRILEIVFENDSEAVLCSDEMVEKQDLDPLERFREFYRLMNGRPMGEETFGKLKDIVQCVMDR